MKITTPLKIRKATSVKIRTTATQLLVCISLLAAVGTFAQTTRTWVGATGGDLGTAGNWSPSGAPAAGDRLQWNGGVSGALSNNISTSIAGSGAGVGLTLLSGQTSSLILDSSANNGTLRISNVTINASAGAFTLGDGNGNWSINLATVAGSTHTFLNDSGNTATWNFDAGATSFGVGGGGTHTLIFSGAGNWAINHYLKPTSSGGGNAITLQKNGAGTMVWTAAGTAGAGPINSPVTIGGGTLSLRSAGLLGAQSIANSGTLEYNAPSTSQTLSGVISGTGALTVTAGALTLSGVDTYSGTTTVSSGASLINGGTGDLSRNSALNVLGSVDLGGFAATCTGLSGTGLLSNSVPNTATLTVSCSVPSTFSGKITDSTGSGGGTMAITKTGPATLTLAGVNSYTGDTTISNGTVLFQTTSGGGNITVADSAVLDVTVGAAPLAINNFILGASAGGTLLFNGINSTTTAPIIATNLTPNGTVTVNINSGAFAVGQSYPLLTWLGGTAPTAALGTFIGYGANLSVSGNTLYLNITSIAYFWSGANNGNWDLATANNWTVGGSPATYADGNPITFDDTASGTTAVTVNAVVSPASVTVNNTTKTYSISSSSGKVISGSTGLLKTGTNTLTLSGGVNAYTGATTISSGTLIVGVLANGGSASDIGASASTASSLVLDGGALNYTGGALTIDRLFSVSINNGTLNVSGSGPLNLANTGAVGLAGSGNRTLTITGTSPGLNTLAATLGDNGGATSLTLGGSSAWLLSGASTYTGTTTVGNGLTRLGNISALGAGSLTVNSALDLAGFSPTNGTFNGSGIVSNSSTTTAILTVGNGNGTFSGTIMDGGSGKAVALALKGGGTLTLTGTNTYSGSTTIKSGTLQLGNGGTNGSIVDAPITNNGTLIFNHSDNVTFNSVISGGTVGSVSIYNNGSGVLTLNGVNTFLGNVALNAAGATLAIGNNSAVGAGTLRLVSSPTTVQSSDATSRTITNTVSPEAGSGNFIMGSAGSGDLTFSGPIVTGNAQKGFTINNTRTTFSGIISDGGSPTGPLTKTGSGTLLISNAGNLTTKQLVVNGGPLQLDGLWNSSITVNTNGLLAGIGSAVGPVQVNAGGSFAPGGLGSIGTFTVTGGNLSDFGKLYISANKSLAPSNSFVSVSGSISLTNSTLIVSNLGPALVAGDKFTLFSQPVTDITGMTIVAPSGIAFTNNLAVDGSISVVSTIAVNRTNITATVSGSQLILSWPADHTGWLLQAQTNSLAVGLGTNWVTIPGTDSSNTYTNIMNTSNGSVFYRLISP